MKRLLDCNSSDFKNFSREDLLDSIRKSEGRTLVCETIGVTQPMLFDVTNAEFVTAMGTDMIILNLFDVKKPVIKGLPDVPAENIIKELKHLTGRPIGVNLEPVEIMNSSPSLFQMTEGRTANLDNVANLIDMGADFIVLTGNPDTGVKNKSITDSLHSIRKELGNGMLLIAGKMHGSGILSESGEHIVTKEDIKAFVEAGADIILIPAPGTVPGITMEYVKELVSYAHNQNVLTMTSIGTSQEGADISTIREIALMCKMTGTDLHHLGDSGYIGMPLPENITAYSTAIRGVRHTYHRMAASINR